MRLMRLPLLATTVAAFAVSPALAQTSLVEIDDRVTIQSFTMTADDLDDRDVYDAAGNEIGEIEEVLGPDASTPTHVAIEFEDDIVDNDDDRLVEITALSMVDGRVVLDMDLSEIEALPRYDD